MGNSLSEPKKLLRKKEVHYEISGYIDSYHFTKFFKDKSALKNRKDAVDFINEWYKHCHCDDRYLTDPKSNLLTEKDWDWIFKLCDFSKFKNSEEEQKKYLKNSWAEKPDYYLSLTAYFSKEEVIDVYEKSDKENKFPEIYYENLFYEARAYDEREINVPDMKAKYGGNYEYDYGCTRYISDIPNY